MRGTSARLEVAVVVASTVRRWVRSLIANPGISTQGTEPLVKIKVMVPRRAMDELDREARRACRNRSQQIAYLLYSHYGSDRHCYPDDEERERSSASPAFDLEQGIDPLARTYKDLIAPEQLAVLRILCRGRGLDPIQECQQSFRCAPEELNNAVAKKLISRLQK